MPDKSGYKNFPIQGAGVEYIVVNEKEPLILFEEDDWSIQQRPNFFQPAKLSDLPQLAHKHKNWRGKDTWKIANYWDFGMFYNFSGNGPNKDWDYQCSKCGEDPPSEVKTRFNILDD